MVLGWMHIGCDSKLLWKLVNFVRNKNHVHLHQYYYKIKVGKLSRSKWILHFSMLANCTRKICIYKRRQKTANRFFESLSLWIDIFTNRSYSVKIESQIGYFSYRAPGDYYEVQLTWNTMRSPNIHLRHLGVGSPTISSLSRLCTHTI